MAIAFVKWLVNGLTVEVDFGAGNFTGLTYRDFESLRLRPASKMGTVCFFIQACFP